MKNTGIVLVVIGFLVGAYGTVLHEWSVNWAYFIPALVAGFVGVTLLRISARRSAKAEHRVQENINNLEQSLGRIVDNMKKLNEEKDTIPVYELHSEVDDLFLEDLDIFAEARESIGHGYTLQDYADVMSHFAAGERYLNRVWSTSVDGYIDEAHEYIDRAERQFLEVQEKLEALREKD